MRWSEVEEFAAGLPGVRFRRQDGLRLWRLHGRLVARQLDTDPRAIRISFDLRPSLLIRFPGTFSVPARFEKHMMMMAELTDAEPGDVEQALEGAWALQSHG
ncbi:MAG TPA: hypothetical protein VIM19_16700 [Actinomycetes bacterium]